MSTELKLGSAPEQGATGTVTEPVAVVDARPTSKGEIVHTTSKETVDQLLTQNWIWSRTVVWDKNMGPGTIIDFWPIHPQECNWPNNYVSKMFNAWTGTMKLRMRAMATAFNGGSVRLGFLPPNLTPAQVRQVRMEMLTTYPSVDFDPKDTDWFTYEPTDQRNVMYHYNRNPDYTDPSTFGGYIVIFVVGRLVTVSDIARIDLLVELAGNFSYLQPSPLFLNQGNDTEGPIQSLTNVTAMAMCDDRACSTWTTLQVVAGTFRRIAAGYFCAYGANKRLTTDFNGIRTEASCVTFGAQVRAGTSRPITSGRYVMFEHDSGSANFDPKYLTDGEVMARNVEIRTVSGAETRNFTIIGAPYDDLTKGIAADGWPRVRDTTGVMYLHFEMQGNVVSSMGAEFIVEPFDQQKTPIDVNPQLSYQNNTLELRRADESFVLWVDGSMRTFNIQTIVHGRELTETSNTDTTWLYDLLDTTVGTSVMYVRLWPEGYWTTTILAGSESRMLDSAHVYDLQFVQELPPLSPIPAPTAVQRLAILHSKRVLPFQ